MRTVTASGWLVRCQLVRLSHFDPCRLARPVKESCERDRERSNAPPFPNLPPPAAGWGREEGGERRSRSRLQDFSHRPGELDGVVFETKTVELDRAVSGATRHEKVAPARLWRAILL